MPTEHIAKNEDHIASVARAHQFKDCETVWSANDDLKARRSDPCVLYTAPPKGAGASDADVGVGDKIIIPDPVQQPASGAINATHDFQLSAGPLHIRIRILKHDFTPIDDAPYELSLAAGTDTTGFQGELEDGVMIDGVAKPFKGKTKGGKIEQAIPTAAAKATLTIRVKAEDTDTTEPQPAAGGGSTGTQSTGSASPAASSAAPAGSSASSGSPAGGDPPPATRGEVPITWELYIGKLNPVKEKHAPDPDGKCIPGVQQRLNNLCLDCGPVDGVLGANTKAAVAYFVDIFDVTSEEGKEIDLTTGDSQIKLFDVHDAMADPPTPTAPSAQAATQQQSSASSAAPASATQPASQATTPATTPAAAPSSASPSAPPAPPKPKPPARRSPSPSSASGAPPASPSSESARDFWLRKDREAQGGS